MESRELGSIAFPKLGEAELASLGRCPLMVPKRHRVGETLVRQLLRDRGDNLYSSMSS